MHDPAIERYAVPHPEVPPTLEGLRILHLSDPHITLHSRELRWWDAARDAIADEEVDLVLLTGDYMTRGGDERRVLDRLRTLASAWKSTHGAVGIFGNHDSATLRDAAREIPGIEWLSHGSVQIPQAGLVVLGSSYPEDVLAAASSAPRTDQFRILLVHTPTEVYSAASLNIPVVLAGHTHGGQLRLSPSLAPYTSCALPSNLATGMLRLGSTLCCVSRGMGEGILRARLNCPRQIAVYTLTRGALPGGEIAPAALTMVQAW